MNCCRETEKAGTPPGNGLPEAYLKVGPTPEDARKDGHNRGRGRSSTKYPDKRTLKRNMLLSRILVSLASLLLIAGIILYHFQVSH